MGDFASRDVFFLPHGYAKNVFRVAVREKCFSRNPSISGGRKNVFSKQDSDGAASRRRTFYYEQLKNVLRRNDAENELESGHGLGLGIGRNYILL